MPTYRNNSDTAINYESKGKLYSFPPKSDYEAKIWFPYQELGLELVNPDYPPVPDTILLSSSFNFDNGLERKFSITHCNKYHLKATVKHGAVRIFAGQSQVGVLVKVDDDEDKTVHEMNLDWDKAPFLRFLGEADDTKVRIDAEIVE